jgi:hypothetical protein
MGNPATVLFTQANWAIFGGPVRPTPAPDPRRRLKWAVTVLRTVAVAAIPIATVLTVDAVFDV